MMEGKVVDAMTTPDPITPPPELVGQWLKERPQNEYAHTHIATQAARWGWEQRGAELQKARDEELEACCEWLDFYAAASEARDLRIARRPKAPSLKAQAFAALKNSPTDPVDETLQLSADSELIIRRALSLLNDDD